MNKLVFCTILESALRALSDTISTIKTIKINTE